MDSDTFLFKLVSYNNGTVTGKIVSSNHTSGSDHIKNYDASGALYYILAVIFMYGCSILMMIASFVKKSTHDTTGITYIKDLQGLEKMQLQQEKFRTKLQMHQKRVHRILGPDRAEVLDENGSKSPSPLTPTEEIFSWDDHEWEDRRPSGSSVATTIVCSDDLHSADLPFFMTSQWSGYEENGFLSAPNSPTVPHKELPGASSARNKNTVNTTSDENNSNQSAPDELTIETPGTKVIDNRGTKLSDNKGNAIESIPQIVSSDKMRDIPEVRIHTCE